MENRENNILDNIFIQITDENKEEVVPVLLNALFGSLSVNGENDSVPGQKFMEKLLER